MRFNEFNTINEDVLTEQELVVESALKDFLEDTITKEEFFAVCEQQGVTRDTLNEIVPLAALGLAGARAAAPMIARGAGKAGSWLKNLFKGKPKQGELPLKGGSNTRPSAPAAAAPKPPAAAPKTKPSNVGKVAGGAALGAAGTAAVLGTDGDAGPDKAQAAAPKPSGNMDDSSFGKAFAAARKQQGGPGGVFTWRGKKYQTNVKGEKYAKNPTAVSFGAPKPAAPSTPQQTGGAGGEFATSKPAANTTGEITGYSAQQADTVNKMIKKRQAAPRGSTRGQSRLSGSTQSRDI
jgi:hypothetical protein